MNKLNATLLILMLSISISVFAMYAPTNVKVALAGMYPTVQEVAWSQDDVYYVADFEVDEYDTKVWFNANAQWVMKQTDWETMDEVPSAVYNAFASSEYADGMVQDVTFVQFPKWQAVVVVEVGQANEEMRYQLFFTPNGELLRARNVTYLYDILAASVFL